MPQKQPLGAEKWVCRAPTASCSKVSSWGKLEGRLEDLFGHEEAK